MLLLTYRIEKNEASIKMQEAVAQINDEIIWSIPVLWMGNINGKLGQDYIKVIISKNSK